MNGPDADIGVDFDVTVVDNYSFVVVLLFLFFLLHSFCEKENAYFYELIILMNTRLAGRTVPQQRCSPFFVAVNFDLAFAVVVVVAF